MGGGSGRRTVGGGETRPHSNDSIATETPEMQIGGVYGIWPAQVTQLFGRHSSYPAVHALVTIKLLRFNGMSEYSMLKIETATGMLFEYVMVERRMFKKLLLEGYVGDE